MARSDRCGCGPSPTLTWVYVGLALTFRPGLDLDRKLDKLKVDSVEYITSLLRAW